MASTTQAVKKTVNVADLLLKFLFGYIERLFAVNIPKQFTWMKNVYYPWAKRAVNHPNMYLNIDRKIMPFVKGLVSGCVVALGFFVVLVLWFWVFLRSFTK